MTETKEHMVFPLVVVWQPYFSTGFSFSQRKLVYFPLRK
jgi:hypothetical protein